MAIPIGTEPVPKTVPGKPKRTPLPIFQPGEGRAGGSDPTYGGSPGVPQGLAGGIPGPMTMIPGAPPAAASLPQWMLMAQEIDRFLRRKKSPLTGTGKTFAKVAKKWGFDPFLLPAIAGAESSFGQAVAPGTNNPFGWGPHIPFNSWQDAIRQVGRGLHKGYISQGLDTIPEIQRKWAPVGASNDPTNLNSNWVRGVSSFYNQLEKQAGTAPKFPNKNKFLPGMEELIYDPIGSWFGGQYKPGAYGGHESHVHVGGTSPQFMLNSIRLAQRLGLRVGENPYTDRVDPVHTGQSARYGDYTGSGSPSMHYQLFPGRYGPDNRLLGMGADISGAPEAMAQFFQNRLLRGGREYVPMGGGYTPGGSLPGVYGDPTSNVVDDRNAAEWQVAEQNKLNSVFGQALADDAAGVNSPRRKKRKAYVDNLINSLMQGGMPNAR